MLLLSRPAEKSFSFLPRLFRFAPVPLLFYATPLSLSLSLSLSSGSIGIIHHLIHVLDQTRKIL
jgi:hypothetical protein